MKTGRAILVDGQCACFASCDNGQYCSYDPKTGDIGRAVEISRLLAPVIPSKIIAIGLNYREHALEMDMPIPEEPAIFFKPPSSIIGTRQNIIYPSQSSHVDYEAELAVVISKRCKNIVPDKAGEYIWGYTCLNDVTARDLQQKDPQWTRGKSFDTFAPIGPWIETSIDDPGNLEITARLNNEIKQRSSTSDLIFDINYLLGFISHIMTLEQGDCISTGTPPGVGPMVPGDLIEIEISQIGRLENTLTR
ncbi:MAG: fumarylacetoacetate hydrolase family protein [Thermodesulfobacteriota bacterium]|nr:fumarylacetoacetate hydrolase family protein [Thermodesulfobacteriota bacterium]